MENVREAVRTRYGKIAESGNSPCCTTSCCSTDAPSAHPIAAYSTKLGYSDAEISAVPEGANLGLGCGNPQAIAALKPGETVLDLGSGGGFDCFLAAKQVGPGGTVIGVDMTAAMVERARDNATKSGSENVVFRLGEIEYLPVADGTVDVILSNCVINLSPDKAAVFRDAFRVLRSGGRLAISDVVASSKLPEYVRNDIEAHLGCVSGAATIEEIETMLVDAGFGMIKVTPKEASRAMIGDWFPNSDVENYVVSATIEAIKP
ncbi:MAG: arsenite methyltransferase [Pirellulaceae bacterium]